LETILVYPGARPRAQDQRAGEDLQNNQEHCTANGRHYQEWEQAYQAQHPKNRWIKKLMEELPDKFSAEDLFHCGPNVPFREPYTGQDFNV
jgi:hypothetical protein